MAEIEFTCPECKGSLSVDEADGGQEAPCPICGKIIRIPTVTKSAVNASSRDTETSPPGNPFLGCLVLIVICGLAGWGLLNLFGDSVYVTTKGKTYHTERNCLSLMRSKDVRTANSLVCSMKGMHECRACSLRKNRAVENISMDDDDGDAAMEHAKMRTLLAIDRLGNAKYGPDQRNAFGEGGDAWCALGAGYNIELDRRGMLVDIWDIEGKHYDDLGREYPYSFSRKWQASWVNYGDSSSGKADDYESTSSPYGLAAKYLYGDGVEQSDAEAARFLRKAAEQGLAEAQYNLGLMYSNGVGVDQDYEEAMKWYRLAAEQGLAPAQGAAEALSQAIESKTRRKTRSASEK